MLSINNLQKELLNKQQQSENQAKDAFTANVLTVFWRDYLQNVRKKNILIYNALQGIILEKTGDFSVVFKVKSNSLAEVLRKNLHEINVEMKQFLNNYSITHEIEIIQDTAQKNIYTSREKYDFLAEKNQLLHKLRQSLDLDLQD